MADPEEEYADTLEVGGDTKSSARVLAAIKKAERSLNAWQGFCDNIDDVYSRQGSDSDIWIDPDYDLFWSSMEIMKPATYCYPPQPVVSPQFKDRRKLQNTTADLLERSVRSAFERGGIDEAMLCTRDDLIFYNRGQMWVTYEADEKGGGQRVCIEHVDRKDFLHPPARKWSELPWVARRAWLTKTEMRKRFRKASGDAYMAAATGPKPQFRDDDGGADHSRKAGVWEVWHKADNRVYWVADGVSVMLDEGKPHLKLRGFFPCPRPAYGTLRPRTLVPVPDYSRYSGHFAKINSLTRRIYLLLDSVKLKAFIPAGGDIGNAVELALKENDDSIIIPVPSAALMAGASTGFISYLPLQEIAAAITGLIEARGQLFEDFYQLSGISDIMRGATEAEETLGAQRLKSQYGSVRVREKIDELQRIARDVTQISAEIMAEEFSKETLLEMSQMDIKSKAQIEKEVSQVEKGAEEEMKALGEKTKLAAQQAQTSGQQVDPAQAQQQFQQAQQQIIAKYGPMLKAASEQVPIEDVMKLLRDDKARGFAFEIETDSTVLTDEMQEKASRNEFLSTFATASQALMSVAMMGEGGAELAGEMMKFVLQPYRVGRDLNGVIDKFIEGAPQTAQQNQGGEAEKALVEAQNKLAEAELIKANAKVAETEAKAAQQGAENQRKMLELQQKANEDSRKFATELGALRAKISESEAKVRNLDANTELTRSKVGVEAHREQREDVKAVADIQSRQVDQAMSAQDRQRQAVESDRNAAMGERQQSFTESQSDRQQTFAERQAERDRANGA